MKDIALHIMDIVQNSISAGATLIETGILEEKDKDKLILTISDNGMGMDNETVVQVTDPYYTTRTTRSVGLGIPLLKHSAGQAGGDLIISSSPGQGTSITATFGRSHFDCPPPGDIPGVISLLAGCNPSLDFVYRHVSGKSVYVFDTREVKEVLEEIPISDPAVIAYMKEMIGENLEELLLMPET
jgi:hypothetical protein